MCLSKLKQNFLELIDLYLSKKNKDTRYNIYYEYFILNKTSYFDVFIIYFFIIFFTSVKFLFMLFFIINMQLIKTSKKILCHPKCIFSIILFNVFYFYNELISVIMKLVR